MQYLTFVYILIGLYIIATWDINTDNKSDTEVLLGSILIVLFWPVVLVVRVL